ncbi:phage terminase small subunit, partial [Bacillus amyloliquefaciens]
QNAVSHGFFSKYLPEETLSIMEEIQERSPADMIWDQIQIQYAAILRAQKIMFVSDKEEMIKELKKKRSLISEVSEIEEEEYEFQFAWDRHATFLNAQSRAMGELRSLIKQFDQLAHEQDERRLKLEQMRLNIEKTRNEVEKDAPKDSGVTIIDDIGSEDVDEG